MISIRVSLSNPQNGAQTNFIFLFFWGEVPSACRLDHILPGICILGGAHVQPGATVDPRWTLPSSYLALFISTLSLIRSLCSRYGPSPLLGISLLLRALNLSCGNESGSEDKRWTQRRYERLGWMWHERWSAGHQESGTLWRNFPEISGGGGGVVYSPCRRRGGFVLSSNGFVSPAAATFLRATPFYFGIHKGKRSIQC